MPAILGFNQYPIELAYNTGDAVSVPQPDKCPARTLSRRTLAQKVNAKAWRLPDPLFDGFPSTPGAPIENYRKTAIGALCEYLIGSGDVALLNFGGQMVPNNAAWRAVTGGDSVWAQVNFSDWVHTHMPSSAWPVRWAYQQAVLAYYKSYFDARGRDWADYIRLELANEKGVITTPAAVSTTVSGNHSIGATTLNVASASGFNDGDYVTVQGAGAWQSFRVTGKAGTSLGVASGTCSKDYGNSTSNGLVVDVVNGVVVTKAASQTSYFGELASNEYAEIDFDAASAKSAFPELFLWGPALAGGHPDSISALFDSGRSFLDLIDGVNYHMYAKSGTYTGDEQWHGKPAIRDGGSMVVAGGLLAPHWAAIACFRQRTSLPIICTEFGFAPSSVGYGQEGHSAFDLRLFSKEFYVGIQTICSLPLDCAVWWGPDRDGKGNNVNTLDLITPEASMNSAATLLPHALALFKRSGSSAGTVPSGFANVGSVIGQE